MQPNFVKNEPNLAKILAKYANDYKLVEKIKNPRNFIHRNALQSIIGMAMKKYKNCMCFEKIIFHSLFID